MTPFWLHFGSFLVSFSLLVRCRFFNDFRISLFPFFFRFWNNNGSQKTLTVPSFFASKIVTESTKGIWVTERIALHVFHVFYEMSSSFLRNLQMSYKSISGWHFTFFMLYTFLASNPILSRRAPFWRSLARFGSLFVEFGRFWDLFRDILRDIVLKFYKNQTSQHPFLKNICKILQTPLSEQSSLYVRHLPGHVRTLP